VLGAAVGALVLIVIVTVLELMDALRSIASASWPTTVGRLKAWNLRVEEGSEQTSFVIDNLEYTYHVHGKEYSSKNAGYGFPRRMDILWVRASVDRILRTAPDVTVYYNPKRPLQAVLSVGFRAYHFAKLGFCMLTFIPAAFFVLVASHGAA